MSKQKFHYTVTEAEVSKFVEDHEGVREFLNKYVSDLTLTEKSVGLVRFFRWLSEELYPYEFRHKPF